MRGARPDELEYSGPANGLRDIWLELRSQMRGVLEQTTLADIVTGEKKTDTSEPLRCSFCLWQ